MTAQGAKSPLQNWDNTKQPLGKTYRIPCSWEMSSFKVDKDIVEDYNEENCL